MSKTCPLLCWHYLSSRAVTRKVLSATVSLTSVFGMGTGGPSPQSTPTIFFGYTLKTEHHKMCKLQEALRARCSSLGQALGLLVPVSCTHCCAYTPGLSTT